MTTDEVLRLINEDPDFVNLKRFDYSLAKVMERFPDGDAPDRIIAQALLISEDDVQVMYDGIVQKLRVILKVE